MWFHLWDWAGMSPELHKNSTACTALDFYRFLLNYSPLWTPMLHNTPPYLLLNLSFPLLPPSFLFSLLPLISDPLGGGHNPVFTAGPARARWHPGEGMEKPSNPTVHHWGHTARTTRATGWVICVCLPICLFVRLCVYALCVGLRERERLKCVWGGGALGGEEH